MVKVFDDWKKKRKTERDKIHFTRKWPFALILGALLGIGSLLDQGALTADLGLKSPCRVEVIADTLPLRTGPDPTATAAGDPLKRGAWRGATTTIQNGYRQLSDGNWALSQYLRPLPPADKCNPS